MSCRLKFTKNFENLIEIYRRFDGSKRRRCHSYRIIYLTFTCPVVSNTGTLGLTLQLTLDPM